MKAPIPDISQDLFDLTGYCSIVTGASAGIGLTIAEALAYRGSDLVLASRNAERLEEAAEKVRAIDRRAVALAADVADDDTPERIVEAALGLGDRIDVLVNNAGFMTFADPFIFLASEASAYITGKTFHVNGGLLTGGLGRTSLLLLLVPSSSEGIGAVCYDGGGMLRCHYTDPLRKIAKPTCARSPTNRKAGSRLQDRAGALLFESHSMGALRWRRKWRCP